QIVNLYDDGKAGRQVDRVRSTNPARFQARLLPLAEHEVNQHSDRAGKLIARAEVVPFTEETGPIEGNLEVVLANESRAPDVVPVGGEVVRHVDCRPSTLVLPRHVGERLVYSGQLLVFSRDKQPIHVRIESTPPGVRA